VKKGSLTVSVGLALGILAFTAPVAAQQTYTIATGSTGGTSFFVGSAMAQVINKYSENIRLEVLPTGGTVETSGFILRGKAQFGLLTPSSAVAAFNGEGAFEGNPVENLRAVWGGYYNYHNFIAPTGRGIESLADLKGKKVGLCPKGTTCSKIAIATLAAAGLTLDDIDEQFLSFNEQVAAMADRKLDAAAMFGGVPGAAILNATSQMDMIFLPLSEEIRDIVNGDNIHFLKIELPAGTYRGQDAAIPSMGTEVLFVGASEVSREVLEEISEILYANSEELASIMPLMGFFKADNPLTLQDPAIPRHEGFEAYLMDSGAL